MFPWVQLMVLMVTWGCACVPTPPPAAAPARENPTPPTGEPPVNSPADAVPRSPLYREALREFERGDYFKPIIDDASALYGQLAPLVVQETRGTDDSRRVCGAVLARGQVDDRVPTVYYEETAIDLDGRSHIQMRYVWFYPPWAVEQLIITLATDGRPVMWEIQAGPVRAVFVSRSIEEAAARINGPALAGRTFAIEPSLQASPDIIVPRTLADSPVVVGPWVYLAHTPPHVTTVLCRCMPSQVNDFRHMVSYRLAPASDLRILGETRWTNWESRVGDLRLPPEF